MGKRLVLVTGGAKGIGHACAQSFSELGDRVIVCGRDEAALADVTSSGDISARQCDITDEASVDALFTEAGPVDVLVNNAGVAHSAPAHCYELSDWERMLAVNATGAFLCTRAALRGMRDRSTGRIVTVASVAGLFGRRYTAGYTASKHAAIGLMRAVSAEVAGTGITANAVCPGYVRSAMTDRSVANIVDKTGRSEAEALEELLRFTPLGRLVEPAEVAHAVCFLASDLAGAINGQTIALDGGGVQS